MCMKHPKPIWLDKWKIEKGQRLSPETEFKPSARYVKLPCKVCGSMVRLTETKAKKYWAGFCSKECAYNKRRTGLSVEKTCKACDSKYNVRPGSKSKFCSIECHDKFRRKPWTDFDKHLRQSWKYKEWRSKVLVRDNFICQKCKKKGNIAHHLELFALNPEKRFDINNGMTLCRKCHIQIHNKELH